MRETNDDDDQRHCEQLSSLVHFILALSPKSLNEGQEERVMLFFLIYHSAWEMIRLGRQHDHFYSIGENELMPEDRNAQREQSVRRHLSITRQVTAIIDTRKETWVRVSTQDSTEMKRLTRCFSRLHQRQGGRSVGCGFEQRRSNRRPRTVGTSGTSDTCRSQSRWNHRRISTLSEWRYSFIRHRWTTEGQTSFSLSLSLSLF